MTQHTERLALLWVGAVSLVLTAVFFGLTVFFDELEAVWNVLLVVFLGLLCQCAMRFFLTTGLRYDHDRLFVTTSGWFQKNRLDHRLIRKDPVRQWADLSNYDPVNFTVRAGQRELGIQHTCTLELVNELNAVLAFLPLLIAIPADRKRMTLLVMLALALLFSARAVYMALRARHYRFIIKSGRN
ncbi:MAG: hypothetical protein J6T14_07080 [Clostridia bacterium]|nr:hypothetical protein [Clostridia bacterium]MBO7690572.1 hypothetical protein [Clostridia bacterium]MBP5271384.1 hypothetical protein [Clostridia bacterium]